MLTDRAIFPGRIAARGDLQRLAEPGDGVLVAVLSNDLKL
jgi:hypothetical protein